MRTDSLRIAVTGAAPVPVSLVERMRTDLGFDTVLTAYGLTESMRHRLDVPPGRRRRDHLHHVRSGHPRRRGAHRRRRGRRRPHRRAGRDPRPRLQRDEGLLRGPGEDGRVDRRRRLAAHRRRRHDGRPRLHRHHRPHQGHVHRAAASTPTRRRSSRLLLGAPRHRPGRGGRRARRAAGGGGLRLAGPDHRRRAPGRGRDRRLGPREDGQLQGAPSRALDEALPLNPSGKVQKFELRDDATAVLAPDPGDTP